MPKTKRETSLERRQRVEKDHVEFLKQERRLASQLSLQERWQRCVDDHERETSERRQRVEKDSVEFLKQERRQRAVKDHERWRYSQTPSQLSLQELRQRCVDDHERWRCSQKPSQLSPQERWQCAENLYQVELAQARLFGNGPGSIRAQRRRIADTNVATDASTVVAADANTNVDTDASSNLDFPTIIGREIARVSGNGNLPSAFATAIANPDNTIANAITNHKNFVDEVTKIVKHEIAVREGQNMVDDLLGRGPPLWHHGTIPPKTQPYEMLYNFAHAKYGCKNLLGRVVLGDRR
jgi:hypothetical protein